MKIVVGYDGSNSAKKALELVENYKEEISAIIYVVLSLSGSNDSSATGDVTDSAEAIKEAETILEYAQKKLSKQGLGCETHLLIRGLNAGEDIIKFAGDVNADFVIVGIGKTSRMGKMFFGSTAQYIILEAHCPVITTK
jgi:nucleotide-binding universal stress UspA family protein